MTIQEVLYRERKVVAIVDAMDRVMRHRVTADQAEHLSLEQMTVIITLADVRPPSKDTMAAVADRLIQRDREWDAPIFAGGCPSCGAERNKGREWVSRPYKCECSPEKRAICGRSPTEGEAENWNRNAPGARD